MLKEELYHFHLNVYLLKYFEKKKNDHFLRNTKSLSTHNPKSCTFLSV